MQLNEGDHLDITIKDGVIQIEPVAVYSKAYIKELEDTVMQINEDHIAYNVGPFKSVDEAIEYLESSSDDAAKESKKRE